MPIADALAHHATPKTIHQFLRQGARNLSDPTVPVVSGFRKVTSDLQGLGSFPKIKVSATKPEYWLPLAIGSTPALAFPTAGQAPLINPDSALDNESDASSCEVDHISGPNFTVTVDGEEPISVQSAGVIDEASDHRPLSSKFKTLGPQRVSKIGNSKVTIMQAIQKGDSVALNALLDAHPYAGPDPTDKSASTLIARFFRKIACCFNGSASKWQGSEAVKLLNKAAELGNVAVISILLDRCMDLGKDRQMIAPALLKAVKGKKPEATELLLKKILEISLDHSPDVPLTAIAARGRRAHVLEILVSNGMALPPRAESWARYGEAINNYLRWCAAFRQKKASPEVLSCGAQTLLVENHLGLNPEFNRHLNGRVLNEAQKAYAVETLVKVESEAKALLEVDAEIYTKIGFTQETAKAMADGFNANASLYIARTAGEASATLARAVSDVFNNFKDNGFVWPYLRKYLMNHGMYGVLADLVVTALNSAAGQSTTSEADREMLLADALEKCAGEAEQSLDDARNASGDPDLFHKLLSPQLDLLIAYCGAQHKGNAATTSAQATSSLNAD